MGRTSNFRQGAGEEGEEPVHVPDESDAFPQGELFDPNYTPTTQAAPAEEEDDGGGGSWWNPGSWVEAGVGAASRLGEIVTDPSQLWDPGSVVEREAERRQSGGNTIGGAIAASWNARMEAAQEHAARTIPTPEEIGQELIDSYQRTGEGFYQLARHPGQAWDLINSPTQWIPAAKNIGKYYWRNPDDFLADMATGATISVATAGAGALAAKGLSKVGRGGTTAARVAEEATQAARLLPDADTVAEAAPRTAAFESGVARGATTVERAASVADDVARVADNVAGAADNLAAPAQDASRASLLERFDLRRNAAVERRLQRRSDWKPGNIARRITGRDTVYKPYGFVDRQMNRLGDWVAGGPDATGSPNALRQWAGKSISRTETMPVFPEGTNSALEAYKMAQWRNAQVMRPVNRVRAITAAPEKVEEANAAAAIAADPKGYMQEQVGKWMGSLFATPKDQRRSIYGDEDETVVSAAPQQTRLQRQTSPMYETTPASQAYGQQPYAPGRGYRGY